MEGQEHKEDKIKVAGVVIFYNPTEKDIQNINTYINHIDRLYVIDNTSGVTDRIFDKKYSDKINYIPLMKNKGLGCATNIGCKKAYGDGFDWVLILDQDTKFEADTIGILKAYAKKGSDDYALYCPNIIAVGDNNEEFYTVIPDKKTDVEIKWATASGSLIRSRDFCSVGGVWEELFIEHLDVELGIKLNRAGLKQLRVGSAIMRQRFGNSQPRRFLWKTIHPGYTKPIRYYYIFRNQELLKQKYGRKINSYTGVHLYTAVIKIVFFEGQKFEKIKMAIKGTLDGRNGVTGEAVIK